MLKSLETLDATITEMKDKIGGRFVEIDDIFLWLDRFIRNAFASDEKEKKGDDLMVPLDAAFNISIQLFGLIDKGNTGLDDKMVEELTKIKTKYLGM